MPTFIGARRTLLTPYRRPAAPAPAAGDTTPLLIGGGFIDPTASVSPKIATSAIAPAGSVIVACVATFGAGSTPTAFTDTANSYSAGAGTWTWFSNSFLQVWSSNPIAADLPAGTLVGPTTGISTKLYMIVFAFPGALSRDPETPAFAGNFGGSTTPAASVDIPAIAGADTPQYVAFFGAFSSQASEGTTGNSTTAAAGGFTNLGAATADNGGFGLRGWVKKLPAANASPTTCSAVFNSGGGGVTWAAGQRTIKVSS
jgi:hypothetical protein